MKFQTKQKRKTYSDSLKINYLHEAIKISLTKKNIPYKIPYRDRQPLSIKCRDEKRWKIAFPSAWLGKGARGIANRNKKMRNRGVRIAYGGTARSVIKPDISHTGNNTSQTRNDIEAPALSRPLTRLRVPATWQNGLLHPWPKPTPRRLDNSWEISRYSSWPHNEFFSTTNYIGNKDKYF